MSKRINKFLLLVSATALLTSAAATATDIADSPLITSAGDSVKPNLLFILDNSGSMNLDALPDHIYNSHCKSGTTSYSASCCADDDGNTRGSSTPCWRDTTGYSASNPFDSYRGQPPFLASDFNTIYYNPAITYLPPRNAAGAVEESYDTQAEWESTPNDFYAKQGSNSINLLTKFPDIEWCTNATDRRGNYTYEDCVRNDNYLVPGTVTIAGEAKAYTIRRSTRATGSGRVIAGLPNEATVSNRSFGPHYYVIEAGEYCDGINLRNCRATAGGAYTVPAPVRWCKDTSQAIALNPTAGNCQALYSSTFNKARYPVKFGFAGSAGVPGTPAVDAVPASVTFSISLANCATSGFGGGEARVTAVTVSNVNLMGANNATPYTTNQNTLANEVRSRISSSTSNYIVSGSNNSITLTAVALTNITSTVSVTFSYQGGVITRTCSGSISPSSPKFSGYKAAVAEVPEIPAVPPTYPGSFRRVDIVSGQTYPRAATRSDCSGSACSYAQEMTNFANWWAYYHTRMQMMKSSAALAFNPIGDKYRVGFAEINIKTRNKNIATFDTATKAAWYTSLRDSVPDGSTPLQTALARAGRIYAGANLGSGGADPVQYSCQQNFSILSSDGYWNGDVEDAVQINGSTPVGQQDGDLDRPYFDGNSSSNNLADLAAYYYNTDLRTSNCVKDGINVCTNNVPTGGLDTASHQHMTTFTVGLGIPGLMQYQTDYDTATSGDFFNIKTGQPSNAAGGICSWLSSGTCAWPNPTSITEARIDDLWHAAVNGRGKYYSARDPAALREGLSDALTGVTVRTGSAAAATSSNPNVVAGDNFIFSSTFETVKWTGELKRQSINVSTGQLNAGVDWSARDQLDNQTSRTIYSFDAGAGASKLEPFLWANLNATQRAWFTTPHINGLTQFCSTGLTCLDSASQTAAVGENLVRFIAGDRTNEGDAFDVSKFYRQRDNLLGDIVNAEPVYVKKPLYNYTDSGYAGFVSAQSGRAGTVYAAANDGMLHAFNADNGSERWAFIPTAVMQNLFRLADKEYSKNHRYFVDGTPAVGDAYINGAWSTILVGGLNAGGRSYYALDITDPNSPKALWEFSVTGGTVNETNLGLTFGKPEIAKLKDGTWVVLVTSGYNNSAATGSPAAGNGVGYLYVLNAATGEKIREFSTGTGSAANPSGLAPIRAWVDNTDVNNTAARVYGGDLTGRLYRFDVNGDVGAAGYDTHVLATLGRPITSRPQLGDVAGNAMVFIGTGQFLGGPDLSSSGTNSFYAIKDKLDAVSYGDPRNDPTFIQQTLTNGSCPTSSSICSAGQAVRTNSNNTVNLAVDNGWWLNWPNSGERSFTDADLQLGTLAVTSNIPAADACSVGGSSYINFFDYRSGRSVSTAQNVSSVSLGGVLVTRPVIIGIRSGDGSSNAAPSMIKSVIQSSTGQTLVIDTPWEQPGGVVRRLSWRELRTQ